VAQRKIKKAKKKHDQEVMEGNLVKALSHPLRARALAIFNERVTSPAELARKFDKPVGNVSYHVKKLRDFGCIELVEEVPRRGATEHFYRGVTRSFLSAENWAKLSPDAKNGISIAGLRMQNDASMAALEAGTFDSRDDRHLSCTPITIDEEAWGQVVELLASTLESVIEIQAKAATRLAEKEDHPGFRATISILGFESPEIQAAATPR
jgi:DNA-binding transcriptional ArsR family regulator